LCTEPHAIDPLLQCLYYAAEITSCQPMIAEPSGVI
jgi:hypothetical protein